MINRGHEVPLVRGVVSTDVIQARNDVPISLYAQSTPA
jgi:hypothetical protein